MQNPTLELQQTASSATKAIDWKRVEASIKQRFRREPSVRANIVPTMDALRRIVPHVGIQSTNRRALRNIGTSLIAQPKQVTIISPICLSIHKGIVEKPAPSALVQKHIAFLDSFGADLPPWKLVCLFPPPEREDAEAEGYIREVCQLTEAFHANRPDIEAKMMVDYAPGMIAMEESVIEEIVSSPHLSDVSSSITSQRSKYYHEIRIQSEHWRRRTRRTMAQYIILGRLAALQGALMCNHTSANIRCALYGGGGVLHNPVGFR